MLLKPRGWNRRDFLPRPDILRRNTSSFPQFSIRPVALPLEQGEAKGQVVEFLIRRFGGDGNAAVKWGGRRLDELAQARAELSKAWMMVHAVLF